MTMLLILGPSSDGSKASVESKSAWMVKVPSAALSTKKLNTGKPGGIDLTGLTTRLLLEATHLTKVRSPETVGKK